MINSNGTVDWLTSSQRSNDYANRDVAKSIAVDANGDAYVAGDYRRDSSFRHSCSMALGSHTLSVNNVESGAYSMFLSR